MQTLLQPAMRRMVEEARTPFAVTFSNGAQVASPHGAPAFSLHFRRSSAERRTAAFRHIGLLESYFDGEVDIGGDLRALLRMGMYNDFTVPNVLLRTRNRWHEFRFSNRSIDQAKANARFHYGLGTEFYRQWLDVPLMMYTCAYWKEGVTTVEQAQVAKIDHVCRKIRLAPGERVVDIGCGFGGFMLHAARNYDVHVTGVNTTPEQVEDVQARIAHAGLGDRLGVIEADFRDPVGEFDKVVSIGVLEHAGRDQIDEVVKAHARALKPGGLGMLHFIGHVSRFDTEFFIRKHVFPGGWIPSLSETIDAMERAGLEIVDIENLRRHYALTLDAWAERFDARWETIHALDPKRFDERFRRIWRTYLIGCAEMFRSPVGRTHLFQIVFSKGNISRENYPMTRRFLYAEEASRGWRRTERERETA